MTTFEGALIVGGEFTRIESTPARHIARIDAANFVTRLGSGVDSTVSQLTTIDGQLCAAGDFTASGIDTARGVVTWNGLRWLQIGDGIDAPVYSLTQSAGTIYASAALSRANSSGVIYALEGNHWTPVKASDAPSRVLLDTPAGLLAAGAFQSMDGKSTFNAALFSEGSVSPLCVGTNGAIHTVVTYHDQVIVSGDFTVIEGVPANHIAAWDGQTWHALAGGLDRRAEVASVWRDQLYLGGPFQFADGVRVNYIARWDGANWNDCAGGADSQVRALAVFRDQLFAAGDFITLGSAFVNHIGRWDGSQWTPVMAQNTLGTDGPVTCMSACESALAISGPFERVAGAPMRRIAYFDGVRFAQLSTGLSQHPDSFAIYDNLAMPLGFETWCWGRFTGITPPSTATYLGVYLSPFNNPTVWMGYPTPTDSMRLSLHLALSPTVNFFASEPSPGKSFLSRNGSSSGVPFVDRPVRGYSPHQNNVLVAGDFTSFGTIAAPYLSRYACPCRGDFNRDRSVDLFDYLDFVSEFAAELSSADINIDWTIDFFDYLDFLEDFSAGC